MPNINDYGLPFTSEDGDRKYSALEWREYFSRLIHNGLIQNAANECQVKPQAVPNKTVYVDTGVVFINGAMRVLDAPVTLTVAENTSGNPRIDRVVARLNEASRTIEFDVLEGTPAGSPVAPALTRTEGVYELGLADVNLANGYSTITETEITDQRSDVDLCGASSITIGVIPPKGLDAVTVQLEPETKALYGVENVDDALKCVVPHITSSYIGFAGNVNDRQLCSSFVPAFKDELKAKNIQLGSQIMEYLMDFQSVSLTASEMEEFKKCNDWYDCCNNLTVRNKMTGNANFLALINKVPFAQYGLMYDGTEKFLVDKANSLAGTSFLTLAEVIKSTTAMNLAMKDKEFCEVLRGNTELEKIAFGNTGERLTFLQGSGNFTVPVGVTNLNYVMVSGGGYYPTIGKILTGALAVTPGASLAYNAGNGSLTATLNETTFGGLTTASGTTITDDNCSILLRALGGGIINYTPFGGVGAGAIGGGNANSTSRVGSGIGLISNFADTIMNVLSYRKSNRISDSILVNRLTALGVFGGAGGATGSSGYIYGGGGGGYGASSGQKDAGGIGGCGYGEGGGGGINAPGKASACGSPADTGAKGVLVLFWGQ